MSLFALYGFAGAVIFAMALYRLVTNANLIRKVIALNVMGSGVFLVLVATAWRTSPGDPDPVPLALVITGIVVAVSVTALALALVRQIHAATGMVELDAIPPSTRAGGAMRASARSAAGEAEGRGGT